MCSLASYYPRKLVLGKSYCSTIWFHLSMVSENYFTNNQNDNFFLSTFFSECMGLQTSLSLIDVLLKRDHYYITFVQATTIAICWKAWQRPGKIWSIEFCQAWNTQNKFYFTCSIVSFLLVYIQKEKELCWRKYGVTLNPWL